MSPGEHLVSGRHFFGFSQLEPTSRLKPLGQILAHRLWSEVLLATT